MRVERVTAFNRCDGGTRLGMIAWRAGPPRTCNEEATTFSALICHTVTWPLTVRIPRANPGRTFKVWVIRINFLRLKEGESTPQKRPKKIKGTAGKNPANPS